VSIYNVAWGASYARQSHALDLYHHWKHYRSDRRSIARDWDHPGLRSLSPVHLHDGPGERDSLLMGITVGNQFGNSIPAILIDSRFPSAILTTVEGFTMQKRARVRWHWV